MPWTWMTAMPRPRSRPFGCGRRSPEPQHVAGGIGHVHRQPRPDDMLKRRREESITFIARTARPLPLGREIEIGVGDPDSPKG